MLKFTYPKKNGKKSKKLKNVSFCIVFGSFIAYNLCQGKSSTKCNKSKCLEKNVNIFFLAISNVDLERKFRKNEPTRTN